MIESPAQAAKPALYATWHSDASTVRSAGASAPAWILTFPVAHIDLLI